MPESPQHRADEADRLLNEPLLIKALANIEASAMRELLAAKGEDADRTRRECADRINTVRAIPNSIRAALKEAERQMRGPSSVA